MSTYNDMDDAALVSELATQEHALVRARFALSMNRLDNTASVRVVRRDIARIKTIQGESLMIDSKDDGQTLVVDGAIVTKPDVDCANGVIHVIDFLLVPERGK